MDISSVEDEHAFTIGKTGGKQPRKGRVGGRKVGQFMYMYI
jgi:hypothetical protein